MIVGTTVTAGATGAATRDPTVQQQEERFDNGTVSIDTQGGRLTLPVQENATVSGGSTFAAGTSLTVELVSTDGQSTLTLQDTATVNASGNWSATFDLSDARIGRSFSVTVSKAGTTRAAAGGEVGELAPVAPGVLSPGEIGGLTVPDDGDPVAAVTVDSVRLANGGFVVIHEGGPTGEVVGTSDHLDPGRNYTDLRIDLGEPVAGPATLVAVLHQDANGNGAWDGPGTDGAYASGGTRLTASARVEAGMADTATATRTPTPSPSPSPTGTPAPDGDGNASPTGTSTGFGPGFGAAGALLALLLGVGTAARRH